ncbi:hypothetical protein L1887_39198 [Cichorium endivia]|nr:hypothetical protein L1887_39198 [Cichorium endivia]
MEEGCIVDVQSHYSHASSGLTAPTIETYDKMIRRKSLERRMMHGLVCPAFHTLAGASQRSPLPNYISFTGKVAKNPTPLLLLASVRIS